MNITAKGSESISDLNFQLQRALTVVVRLVAGTAHPIQFTWLGRQPAHAPGSCDHCPTRL